MVDVSQKSSTERMARATGKILLKKSTIRQLKEKKLAKGDVLTTAKIAGILATKKVRELVPLTHPLNITHSDLQFKITEPPSSSRMCELKVESLVKTIGPTGPDIEALTCTAVALLTVYDMVKAVDRSAKITDIYLLEKSGGKSGHYCRREKLPKT